MASNASKPPLVLEYKQRRFDGGPEVELIQHIESQIKHHEQLQKQAAYAHSQGVQSPMGYPQMPTAAGPMPMPVPVPRPMAQPPVEQPVQTTSVAKTAVRHQLYNAVVFPYVEMALGLSGFFIASLMTLPAVRALNPSLGDLRKERQALMHQSGVVVKNSMAGILRAPLTVAKIWLPQA